jgi:predicted 3-demethylubiquinone-9 3-methyltransferase (glyoxalase superfamily)
MQKVTPFLMFEGKAEEAMSFYTSIFEQSQIISIARYVPGEPGTEGTVKKAVFTLNNQEFICIDSNISHGFTFTPAMSLFVKCNTDNEVDHLYEELSEGGTVMMPLNTYPFSKKFGWVTDKYGVSWQLTLE